MPERFCQASSCTHTWVFVYKSVGEAGQERLGPCVLEACFVGGVGRRSAALCGVVHGR